MKISKSDALSVAFSRPELRFEEQDLTSFSGLVLFQGLFARLGLYRRLSSCFRHSKICPIYPQARIILLLIVHTLLGFRCLRDSRYYSDGPLVLRTPGLKRIPSASTYVAVTLPIFKYFSCAYRLKLARMGAIPCFAANCDVTDNY